MKKIYLFDSSKKEKVEFVSQEENKVSIYICGPTVYDDSHLGHARSAIVFDLLHRILKTNGYDVKMAKNFTDIDDKIINKVKQTGQSIQEITSYYIDLYKKDMDILNILPNSFEPKATQNIENMIDMVEELITTDKAYILDDGVYLDTSKDKLYGEISHRLSDENSQARVQSNIEKKDSKDFAIWKFFPENEIGYETSFGYGRPGWHIECSAMIDRYLASKDKPYAIDIHGGGADLLFPHHENEACQTRCATNQELAKYWIHNGFVNIDGQKMSKSLGNSFFLKDALKTYSGESIRFYMLNTHYRSNLNFNDDDLLSSKKRLDKIYRLKKRAYGLSYDNFKSKEIGEFKTKLLEALNDDMNTSVALALIDQFVSDTNEKLDKEPKNKNLKKSLLVIIDIINDLFGIGGTDAYQYFQFGVEGKIKETLELLIQKREMAKQNKEFAISDKIRDELKDMGIALMDTPNGTVWERI